MYGGGSFSLLAAAHLHYLFGREPRGVRQKHDEFRSNEKQRITFFEGFVEISLKINEFNVAEALIGKV